MFHTFEYLLDGDDVVVSYYQAASKIWRELLSTLEAKSPTGIAKLLEEYEPTFERALGCPATPVEHAHEVIAIVGLLQFHRGPMGFAGNKERVARVYRAILMSHCAPDIKRAAGAIADSYDIIPSCAG